jgi:hypothetical protein
MKIRTQGGRCPGRDQNRAPPKYKSRVLPLHQTVRCRGRMVGTPALYSEVFRFEFRLEDRCIIFLQNFPLTYVHYDATIQESKPPTKDDAAVTSRSRSSGL